MSITTLSDDRRSRREALRARVWALRQDGATLATIGVALDLSREQVRGLITEADRLVNDPHWTDCLPSRAINLLRNFELFELPEIEAAQAIAQCSRRELMDQQNVGRVAVGAIITWLAKHGLELRSSP